MYSSSISNRRFIPTIIAALLLLTCTQSLHPEPRIESSSGLAKQSKNSILFKTEKLTSKKQNVNDQVAFLEDFDINNETSNFNNKPELDRIQVSETSKMILQTSLRFALAQSGFTKYMDLETAMDIVNDTGFMLSKPSNLAKVVRFVVIALATIISTAFFFPGTYKFIDATIKDPTKNIHLDKYLSSGIYDKSIISLLGAKVDELLARVGMDDSSCQELTVCQSAKALRCVFPHSTNGLAKLVSEHYVRPKYRQNRYVNSFYSGFVDCNCSSLAKTAKQNCIGTILYGYLLPSDECFNEVTPRAYMGKK